MERVKKVYPKEISHHKLFHIVEAPTVLVVVIAEDGIPEEMSAEFTKEDQYVLFESYAKFRSLSKEKFAFIDLKRFAGTQLLNEPKTELDHWCTLLLRSLEKRIEKKVVEKLRKFPGAAWSTRLWSYPGRWALRTNFRQLESVLE